VERWTALRAIRADVQKRLEELRERGAIGSSLQAEVEIRATGPRAALLQSLGDDLRFVLITSQARVEIVGSEADEAIVVTPSAATKCERCWHWRDDVGHAPDHPTLCGRCVSNLFGAGEPRTIA
jgi:isoleucyl-tRNA synthetase